MDPLSGDGPALARPCAFHAPHRAGCRKGHASAPPAR